VEEGGGGGGGGGDGEAGDAVQKQQEQAQGGQAATDNDAGVVATMRLHATVLAQRSEFFEGLLLGAGQERDDRVGGRARWVEFG
jgi:hypothetical protein